MLESHFGCLGIMASSRCRESPRNLAEGSMSKIFISYRRDDSSAAVDALYSRLSGRFGQNKVFRDVSAIPLGVDYEKHIQSGLQDCSILLAIIGVRWLSVRDTKGRRRLDDPKDLVRIEIESSLKRGCLVIPILVGGAQMPNEDDLPKSIKPLKKRHGTAVGSNLDTDAGFRQLVDEIALKLPDNWQPEGWERVLGQRLDRLGFRYRPRDTVDIVIPPVVRVVSGPFRMGGDSTEGEKPVHEVSLGECWIGKYPVTVAEYSCFVKAGHRAPFDRNIPWQDQKGRPDHPVVNISWRDAYEYAAWVAEMSGQAWRLPTEAEWEKAARWDLSMKTSYEYPWGEVFEATYCACADNEARATAGIGLHSRGASPCGAEDMAGNVWEWTSSLYRPYPYGVRDGREDARAKGDRVRRGGSWKSPASNVRGAKRADEDPDNRDASFGFRLALG
jgi:formylglycine-generating enzyme required for sulfatase activity